jgi:flagellar hook-associated protein 1 FlgK
MEVDTLIQDNGSMSIYIAKGISLVNDGTAQPLEAQRDTLDPDKVQILIGEGASKQELGANIQGGIIGGLNNFADTTLNQARHELGRLALVVADEVNAQHALGVDLNGNPGVDLFAGTDPVVYADSLNNGTATLRGRITDVQAIEATEYLLRYDGANFTATRVSDGVSTLETVPIEIDGIALTISGTPAAGDEFLLSATGRAASSVQTLVSNPDKLALAGQLTTASDIGNIGDARISTAKVTDPEDISLTNPVQIVFTSDTAYDIVDSTSGAILVNGAGYIQDDPIALNGWEVSIRGEAKSGDVHTVSPNVIGRGDNSNGISLANMQTSLLVNGNESFSDAYGSLVSQIGSDTSSTLTRTTALESLRDSAIDRQQTSQGVSLDEEAVNLTRYQQAYQAAAQVITTSETMFQSILGAIQ